MWRWMCKGDDVGDLGGEGSLSSVCVGGKVFVSDGRACCCTRYPGVRLGGFTATAGCAVGNAYHECDELATISQPATTCRVRRHRCHRSSLGAVWERCVPGSFCQVSGSAAAEPARYYSRVRSGGFVARAYPIVENIACDETRRRLPPSHWPPMTGDELKYRHHW